MNSFPELAVVDVVVVEAWVAVIVVADAIVVGTEVDRLLSMGTPENKDAAGGLYSISSVIDPLQMLFASFGDSSLSVQLGSPAVATAANSPPPRPKIDLFRPSFARVQFSMETKNFSWPPPA